MSAAAAEALGSTGDASAEPALVCALGRSEEPVRLAAAKALGHVGTTAVVVPLRAVEDEGVDMRRAVRQAIARIQWRVAGAEPGQLSLAGGESGQLSLADGEAGSLSFAEEAGAPAGEERAAAASSGPGHSPASTTGSDPFRTRGKRRADG